MGCIVLGVAGVTLLSTSSVQSSLGVADNDQWDRMSGYTSFGPLVKFVSNIKYMTISKPKGYKTAKADEILSQYEESQAEQDAQNDTTEPNIIMIMNESLADFSEAEESSNISFSTDPLTYFHSMEENTIKGNCYVSAFGGGTANSELEALTGNSMAFFPQGSIVYQVFEKSFIAGMATDLQNLGYTSVVMHPNVSSSWNRSNVYSAMGFSSFLSLEYFENPEYVRSWNWVSDHSTYEKIIDLYEEKDEDTPLFVMDVTMQGHGGYDTASEWETKVTVSGGDFPKAEEYLSSTYVSDKAFQSLIEYFEKQDEPTVILMFGDHQPAVETEFYEALYGTSEESDLSLTQEYYKTPYVLWANYDIEEETKDLSANQLGILAKQVAGVSLTSYDQFVVDFSETIPILNALGYQDTDGNWWSLKKYPSDEYKQLLTNYSYVQYRRYCEWNK
jgi:phosphoglycerol transferase MdoB-like AlkP superfamily enzyme